MICDEYFVVLRLLLSICRACICLLVVYKYIFHWKWKKLWFTFDPPEKLLFCRRSTFKIYTRLNSTISFSWSPFALQHYFIHYDFLFSFNSKMPLFSSKTHIFVDIVRLQAFRPMCQYWRFAHFWQCIWNEQMTEKECPMYRVLKLFNSKSRK